MKAKTKSQISFAVTANLISAFVFATRIVQFFFYLNLKFQASTGWFVSDLFGNHIVGFPTRWLKWWGKEQRSDLHFVSQQDSAKNSPKTSSVTSMSQDLRWENLQITITCPCNIYPLIYSKSGLCRDIPVFSYF